VTDEVGNERMNIKTTKPAESNAGDAGETQSSSENSEAVCNEDKPSVFYIFPKEAAFLASARRESRAYHDNRKQSD